MDESLPPSRQNRRVSDSVAGPWDVPSAAVMAHELRSLLTAITLSLADLRRHLPPETDAALGRNLDIIEASVRQATEVTTWVLNTTMQGAKRPNIASKTVALSDVVEEVARDLAPIVGESRLAVDAPTPVNVEGDDVRIRAIITNLVLTTARRSPLGSEILIDVRRQSAFAEVSVASPAWTPSPEEVAELFRPFNEPHTRVSATGIGLHASRVIARSFGGHLVHEPGQPGGSRLTLRLPLTGGSSEVG